MTLGTLRDGSRDGMRPVVSRGNSVHASASASSANNRGTPQQWADVSPRLWARCEAGQQRTVDVMTVEESECHAPLPRALEWVDGAASVNHVLWFRKARHTAPPTLMKVDSLVRPGGSGVFMVRTKDIGRNDVSLGHSLFGAVNQQVSA